MPKKRKASPNEPCEQHTRLKRNNENPSTSSLKEAIGKQERSKTLWSEEDVDTLVRVILTHGHLNFDEILEELPHQTKESYAKFLRSTSNIAKMNRGHPPECVFNLTEWISVCEAECQKDSSANANGPLELALVLKLLSMDGVLENHPLPENAGGIDFGTCYRVLYQVILGHPIQVVNKPTIDFLYEVFTDLSQRVEQNNEVLDKIKTFLISKNMVQSDVVPSDDVTDMYNCELPKRPVKAYERKKPAVTPMPASHPAVTVTFEPVAGSSCSTVTYSLKTGDKETGVQLALPTRMEQIKEKDEEIKAELDSVTFNPIGFPLDWLKNTTLPIKRETLKGVDQTLTETNQLFSRSYRI